MPAGVAGGATAQTPQGEPAAESTVVGLSTALRISTMDKKQLAALASAASCFLSMVLMRKAVERPTTVLSAAGSPCGVCAVAPPATPAGIASSPSRPPRYGDCS